MKGDLSQKNTWKYDIFFKCSGKIAFLKKSHQNVISCTIRKDGISFSQNIFFLGKKWKMIFLKKIHGNMTNISGTAEKGGADPRKDDIGIPS